MHDKHQTTYPRSLEKLRILFKNPYTHKLNPTLRQKSKNREQILKAVREKLYKGRKIKVTGNLS